MRRLKRKVRKDPSPPAHPFHRLHLSNSIGNPKASAPTSELSLSAGGRAYTPPRHSVSNSFLYQRDPENPSPVPRPAPRLSPSLREAGFYAPRRDLSTDFFHISETTQGRSQNTPQQQTSPARKPGSNARKHPFQPAYAPVPAARHLKRHLLTPLWLGAM